MHVAMFLVQSDSNAHAFQILPKRKHTTAPWPCCSGPEAVFVFWPVCAVCANWGSTRNGRVLFSACGLCDSMVPANRLVFFCGYWIIISQETDRICGDGSMLAVLLAALESDEDRALFTEVYEQYHIRMEKDSMYILNDRSDAEDAVQNAFMQVIRHFDIFFEVPSKKRVFWCISIVKNEALTILRQRKKMVLSDELEGDPVVDV